MELVLVRHAEPDRAGAGRDDAGLSAAGRSQACRVARRLAEGAWSALYCSPQRHAVETGQVISELTGLPLRMEHRLAEFDGRSPAGSHPEGLGQGGDPTAALRRDDYSRFGVDAECIRRRAVEGIDALIAAHQGQDVIVITHGTVINAYVGGFLGVAQLVFHRPAHAGMTRLRVSGDGRPELVSLNESTYLSSIQVPPEPRNPGDGHARRAARPGDGLAWPVCSGTPA